MNGRQWFAVAPTTRGVQIRSESDRIRSDFGTKIYISDRIDKVVSQSDRIGSDFDIRNKMN
jgi:hypothetical protein